MSNKKIIIGFSFFLVFMWLCTLISKSVYTTRLPMVSTISPEEKYIEHKVEVAGIVVEGGKQAVTSLPGVKVKTLIAHVGDRVEEGDILFQIDLDDLKEIIKEKQRQINSLQLQVNTILENQELEEQKKEIEEERAREDYNTTARLENTDVGRAADRYARAAEDLDDFYEDNSGMDEETRNQTQQELLDALQSAAYAEADAKRDRDQAMKEAERNVEDILFPDANDATLSVTQLQISELNADLSKYLDILNQEGNIKAKIGGMITDIYIEAGGRIPDGASMMLTDDNVPCQFKVILDKEQKKYVGFGDEVLVKLDGSSKKMDMTIDYFSESQSMPGSFETLINLPEGTGVPGLSGTLSCSNIGEKYGCCIPPLSIIETDTRSYVYVLREREGILGKEYYVEEVNVKVVDKNENWAAIEGSTLDMDSQIILSADKEFGKGDIVRWIN
ncbi:HlyD family secretion protein [Parablautia muri]|uniref:Biotin/lipoyl-binding protein n=1 Tax=Parablautia muri TaxID=2320879 RepID=A0A9X5GPV3_9FIRM|nr:hypothetical protein [Parablautia muri]NBJ91043.1 hypothetical protein [Parablautia muri]